MLNFRWRLTVRRSLTKKLLGRISLDEAKTQYDTAQEKFEEYMSEAQAEKKVVADELANMTNQYNQSEQARKDLEAAKLTQLATIQEREETLNAEQGKARRFEADY